MTPNEQQKLLAMLRLLLETGDVTPMGARELMRVLDLDGNAS